MKRTCFIATIIVLGIAALGISRLYFFSRLNGISDIAAISKGAEAEQKSSDSFNKAESVTIAPVYKEKPNDTIYPKIKPVVTDETKHGNVSEQKPPVETIDKFAAQTASESLSVCETCIVETINILGDPSYDKNYRKDSAKALIKSGTKEGVLAVFKAIIDAHMQNDYELKDGLMPIIADINSAEAADTLTDVLIGKTPFSSDPVKIPEDIAYAIKNAIRLIPNEVVGETLAQKYRNATSEEEKSKLLDINHPVMIARLAADALGQDDNKTADRLMEELTGVDDNSAIRGIMMLAREKSVPLDNAANILSFWDFTTPDKAQTHFTLVEYLGNADFSPEERALAAHAMVNEKDKEMAISALKKAQLFEEDPLVQEYIENALSQIAKSEAVE
jgi:hypothetical protein